METRQLIRNLGHLLPDEYLESDALWAHLEWSAIHDRRPLWSSDPPPGCDSAAPAPPGDSRGTTAPLPAQDGADQQSWMGSVHGSLALENEPPMGQQSAALQ